MAGSKEAGTHEAGTVAGSFHPEPQAGDRESETRPGWTFVSAEPTLSDTPPLARPHLLILPKQSSNWKSNIQVYEPLGPFSLEPIYCMCKIKEEKSS